MKTGKRMRSTDVAADRSSASTYSRALGLGAVAGLRSAVAPAVLSYSASRDSIGGLRGTRFGRLASRRTAAVLALMAAGELVADKLPSTPARTAPPSLAFRAASGALVGAGLTASARAPVAIGAVLGALGAIAGSFAGLAFRRQGARRLGVPDLPLALVEDAVAVGGGLLLARR